MPFGLDQTGGPNEPWSFGDEAYEHITAALLAARTAAPLRHDADADRARRRASRRCGRCSSTSRRTPPAWAVDDAYMFGPDLLVAPVADYGARERHVYLPAGASGRTRGPVRYTRAEP